MKALIAMSGGVDSSVAALLAQKAGYDCIGCTMKLYDLPPEFEGDRTCCTAEDAEDARAVAYKLGMPFYVFNFKDEFKECVIKKFADTYARGMTPNPCVDCNKKLKFGKLFDRAKELGCDAVVTGHYARIVFEDGVYKLKKGLDPSKDQSYMLYGLTQDILAHTLFPLGEMTKSDTRKLAEKYGLITARKRDSQDICFVPDGKYAGIVTEYSGKDFPIGDYIDDSGKVIGKHKGIIHYTIGQHKRLGISTDRPLYVSKIDPVANTVTLSSESVLFTDTVRVSGINLIYLNGIEGRMRVSAKIRYRQKEAPAFIEQTGKNEITLIFDEPVRAVTKGQAAVFYDGDTVIGGGTVV